MLISTCTDKLTKGSSKMVDVQCDYCYKIYKISFKYFNNAIKTIERISCSEQLCINKKRKDIFIHKYGVDNPNKIPGHKEKVKNTNLKRYGVDHYSKTNEFKIKTKETCLERYGVDSYSKTDECLDKMKNTCLERYGVDNYSKTDECLDKMKNTNINKYGVEHFSKTDEYIEKSKNTSMEKYGVEYYSKTDEYKERVKNTCLDKYEVKQFIQSTEFRIKTKETCLERYGVEHVSQTKWFKEDVKNTCLERYGVDSYTKTDEYKERIKNSNLNKYGKEWYMNTNEFITKSKNTLLGKYGVDNYQQSEIYHLNTIIGNDYNFIKYLDNGISLFNCDKEHTFEINQLNYHGRIKYNTSLCTVCNPIGDSKSIKEKDLYEYIKSIYYGKIIQSYRDKLEIDIYLPELKIGFEFNGLYWHSDKYKEKNYHLDKTNWFKDKDIRIIHIWEDDWIFRQDIVKSQINNLVGNSKKIFARKCVIKEVSAKESRIFLDSNHIQGFVSSKIKIGLYHQDELVSIMTFDSFEGRKKMEDGGYNLSRFCNKINTNVVGGASKLLSYFIKEYKATRIVSYADKDWSVGSLYYTLGFENILQSKPDYKYIVDNKRIHKSRYRKSKLGIQGTSITEHQETKRLNIYRIYDCGKIKFEYKKRAS